jgi:hypothetical protein
MAAACCYWDIGVYKENTTSMLSVTTYLDMRRMLKDRCSPNTDDIHTHTDNESALKAEIFAKLVKFRSHFLHQCQNMEALTLTG